MKNKCPICGKRHAKRACPQLEKVEICSLCCVDKRDDHCGTCEFYIAAKKYKAVRDETKTPPDGHFIIEVNPEVEDAVDNALKIGISGKLEPAMKAMQALVDKYPRNHDVCFGMGALFAIQEDHENVIKWCDRAIEFFPYFVNAYYNRAVSYGKLGEIPEMIRSYQKVVQFGASDDEVAQKAQADLKDAAALIMETEGVDLFTFLAVNEVFARSYDYMEQREWAQALKGFSECAEKMVRHAPTHGNMGICLSEMGRKAEALAELDKALTIDPGYAPAKYNRANIVKMTEGTPMNAEGVGIKYGYEAFLTSKDS